MLISPDKIYEQKVNEIHNRLNSRMIYLNQNVNFNYIFKNASEKQNNEVALNNIDNSVVLNSNLKMNNPVTSKAVNKKSVNMTEIDKIVSEKSRLYNMNENLVRAVIKAESNFNPKAVSGSGAMGLMQLMPATARSLGVADAYDPSQNADGGIRYLKTQIANFNGNVKMALAAYNCGPNRLKSLNITNMDDPIQFSKLPKETQNYVNKIMNYISQKV